MTNQGILLQKSFKSNIVIKQPCLSIYHDQLVLIPNYFNMAAQPVALHFKL